MCCVLCTLKVLHLTHAVTVVDGIKNNYIFHFTKRDLSDLTIIVYNLTVPINEELLDDVARLVFYYIENGQRS